MSMRLALPLATFVAAPLWAQMLPTARLVYAPTTPAWTRSVSDALTTVDWHNDGYFGPVAAGLQTMDPVARRIAMAPLVAELERKGYTLWRVP